MHDFEKLGLFYLGRPHDLATTQSAAVPLLYDSTDLLTHAVCVGMTGSGKTGLCIDLLEEAAIDGIPALAIDPKGDLGNLLLTFPGLRAEDFRPWIDEDEARRREVTPDAWAEAEADTWRRGLAEWGQDGDRIRRLREAVDIAIYTPGSDAGLPLSILKTFHAPPANLIGDEDLLRDLVSTTAASLLGLIGLGADPLKSREHILLSALLDRAWRQGEDVDLATLIALVREPPLQRLGVLELETFYPAADRFELAMALNNLLAAPGFSAWTEGDPLDVQRLLYTADGRPRLTILSIAHLSDAERMFFVALLLNEVLGWTRRQEGTASLRAIVYMDEVAGYLPPVANPASKPPLLTLLKQARAFGVGLVLATQNPVDLDYKALSNAGTWLVGRLQSPRDRERLLDGLEGATSAAVRAFDRASLERTIAGLGKRVFLLHNVHDEAPAVFETRWALSYLRGPLTRRQIGALMRDRKQRLESGKSAEHMPERPAASVPPAADGRGPTDDAVPVLPPEIPQYFAPTDTGVVYAPTIAATATLRFANARAGIDHTREVARVAPIGDGPVPVDWNRSCRASFDVNRLASKPPAGAVFRELPAPAARSSNYSRWRKSFSSWVRDSEVLTLYRSPGLKLLSRPEEAEGDFRVRLRQAAREQRDAAVAGIRQRHARKLERLRERLRRAEQHVVEEQEQSSAAQMNTAISFGATMLGALLGRKRIGTSTVGRATTTARGMRRMKKESADVARAEAQVDAIRSELESLERQAQADVDGLDASSEAATATVETVTIKPRRGVDVEFLALTWVDEGELTTDN